MNHSKLELAWIRNDKIIKKLGIEPGRKTQVIKKLTIKAIKEKDITDKSLIFCLRRTNTIPTLRMIELALTPNKYIKEEKEEQKWKQKQH